MNVTLKSYAPKYGKIKQASDALKTLLNVDDEAAAMIISRLLIKDSIEIEGFSMLKHSAALIRFVSAGGQAETDIESFNADTLYDYVVSHGLGAPTAEAYELATNMWGGEYNGDYATIAHEIVARDLIVYEPDFEMVN